MDKTNKPVVGQTVYSLNVGFAARGKAKKLTEYTVSKVGRKYFKLKGENGMETYCRFRISDWKEDTEYTPEHKLYPSEKAWEEDKELIELSKYISGFFRSCFGARAEDLTIEQLRKIKSIIDGE